MTVQAETPHQNGHGQSQTPPDGIDEDGVQVPHAPAACKLERRYDRSQTSEHE